jgi:hypothetical protein
LFKLEQWIPYQDYNAFDRRVFGFIAERLLTVWVAKNRKSIRISYRPLVFCP